MVDGMTTSERILESARSLFNRKGYSSTTLSEIAAQVGITQGNLTYHFPNKRDLALHMVDAARQVMDARWENKKEGPIAEDYIEHLFFAKRLTWDFRFLLRDYEDFTDDPNFMQNDPYLLSDFDELRSLLQRIDKEGYFNDNMNFDFEVLARSLWIISRFWMDHLRELQIDAELTREDLEWGIHHHFELLSYFLTPEAGEKFVAAKATSLRYLKANWESTPL